jgi:hypothetical protein
MLTSIFSMKSFVALVDGAFLLAFFGHASPLPARRRWR